MKHELTALLNQAIVALQRAEVLASDIAPSIQIERTRDKQHGDYATNLAMVLTKSAKMPPRDLAQQIIDALPASDIVEKTELAGPGFINFFIKDTAQHQVIDTILQQKKDYGRCNLGQDKKINLEFISANPTGPLHVGHGRGAAYGASLASLMRVAGYQVHSEYYVNDAGRQMNILAVSVWLRYLGLFGAEFDFPANGYKGDYVFDIAAQMKQSEADKHVREIGAVFDSIPADEPKGGDKDIHIDALVERAQNLLGEEAYRFIHDFGMNQILDDIRDDLKEFNVVFDEWFSERSLTEQGDVAAAIEALNSKDFTFTSEGATWFKAIHFGDEKDRVLVRKDGRTTYFASDAAYVLNKFKRKFDEIIYIFGADHHGYVKRLKSVAKALGMDSDAMEIRLVQFAVLYRGKEKVSMSTRSGDFVTLRELRDEVGSDAARFFYVMRKPEQHMDFDLELAKSQSSDNPVYYIQYANARICSVMRQLGEKALIWQPEQGLANLALLTNTHEIELIQQLSRYPELIEAAAKAREPHQVAHFLRELANAFHTYYNVHQFIVEDDALRNARLCLINASQQVLVNGLNLLGVSAPDVM